MKCFNEKYAYFSIKIILFLVINIFSFSSAYTKEETLCSQDVKLNPVAKSLRKNCKKISEFNDYFSNLSSSQNSDLIKSQIWPEYMKEMHHRLKSDSDKEICLPSLDQSDFKMYLNDEKNLKCFKSISSKVDFELTSKSLAQQSSDLLQSDENCKHLNQPERFINNVLKRDAGGSALCYTMAVELLKKSSEIMNANSIVFSDKNFGVLLNTHPQTETSQFGNGMTVVLPDVFNSSSLDPNSCLKNIDTLKKSISTVNHEIKELQSLNGLSKEDKKLLSQAFTDPSVLVEVSPMQYIEEELDGVSKLSSCLGSYKVTRHGDHQYSRGECITFNTPNPVERAIASVDSALGEQETESVWDKNEMTSEEKEESRQRWEEFKEKELARIEETLPESIEEFNDIADKLDLDLVISEEGIEVDGKLMEKEQIAGLTRTIISDEMDKQGGNTLFLSDEDMKRLHKEKFNEEIFSNVESIEDLSQDDREELSEAFSKYFENIYKLLQLQRER